MVMAYEHKPNKGSVFPVDDRSGTMILSGKLNRTEWSKKPDDQYPPKSIVVKEDDGRLTLFLQVATLFPEKDESKDWAYSGPCGNHKVFAYANKTKNDQKFLNLSVATGNPMYSGTNADPEDLRQEETINADDIPF